MNRIVNSTVCSLLIGLIIFANAYNADAQNTPGSTLTYRQIFPRNQNFENRMLIALGAGTLSMDANLVKALGPLSLKAAEMEYSTNATITPEQVITEIEAQNGKRRGFVNGILAGLIMVECGKRSNNAPTIALKQWATGLYRSIKIRSAKALVDEYNKWKNNPCEYKAIGYKRPVDCGLGALNQLGLYAGLTPPQDIMVKAGLNSIFGGGADKVAEVAALGSFALTLGASAAMITSSLGATYSFVAGGITTTVTSSLYGAFGGAGATYATSATTATAAGGALSSASWAGVIAAPIAAVILVVVVGTTEGFRVAENTKMEPLMKMKLAAAIEERINITNVLAEESGRSMFFMSFMEATTKKFQITEPQVGGEVRFYCQAGYLTKFKLSYTDNVVIYGLSKPEPKVFNTRELNVGSEESFEIPYGATDIKVQASYAYGVNDWRPLINETMPVPSYRCYTSYGTIFEARYKNDCPEVGNMTVTKPNVLTLTQGGGYTAWVYLSYKQNGKVVIAQDQQGIANGWRKTYNIPADATQIYLYVRNATGLAWEPWKGVIEKTWPNPPNECIKIYGTTLDPKWNAECN